MRVEALIATMNQQDDSILERMNIRSDAFVVNQCDRFSWSEYESGGRHIRFLSVPERGVGLSRNTAFMRAQGDICLFSDDDLIYKDGYEKMLTDAFRRYPKADVLAFNIHSLGERKKRRQIRRASRVRWFNFMHYGAARIAVRRESIQKKNIAFSLLFGGGAEYSSGEDTIFLHDCLKAGLRIYAVPVTLADIDDSRSTWFRGYDDKFLSDKGALYGKMFGRLAAAPAIVYLLRHKNAWAHSGSIGKALRIMCRGMGGYGQIRR